MRALILFIIGIVFGTGTGFLLALPVVEHDHAGHDDPSHEHSIVTAWTGPEPTIAIALMPEGNGAFNLRIDETGFIFAPEHVNQATVQGEGHAHVYLDGVKIARIYSQWAHLTEIKSGSILRVTLHANDHTAWGYNGQPVAAEVVVP